MEAVRQILDSMDSIDLSEMDSVKLMNRVDTKYVFSQDNLGALLESVHGDYRVLRVDETAISSYRTLYFDSSDRHCFRQHHSGKLNRRKYRMRNYVSSGISFLEVKAKNNKGRTDKRRLQIPEIEERLSAASVAFIQSTASNGESAFPEGLLPRLWTNFSRVTLVNRQFPERVTLDMDLEFDFENQRERIPGAVIAEIKQERDNRYTPVRKQLRNMRIRPLRVSKYCLGTMLLNPKVKSNRFKAKLRAIHKFVQ